MGTINYGTNKHITMGLNINNFDDMDDFEKEYEQEFILTEVTDILEKYTFTFWEISIESGYYEGFYIKIYNDWLCFDDSIERKDALKETTQLKRFLLDCLACGLVAVYPGWCTGYADQEETKDEINEAIKNMKNDIKQLPTWKQLEKRK